MVVVQLPTIVAAKEINEHKFQNKLLSIGYWFSDAIIFIVLPHSLVRCDAL
jgi:hypothetical protein